jgi:O-antigen ligase
MVITMLGLLFNRTATADPVYDIGAQRWMFLLATHSFALALWPPTPRGYRLFIFFIGVVGIYGVFQSFTGIDLLRPGEHRAVQPLDQTAALQLWRSAGLFGSPMQYGYIAGIHACLPLAVAMLTFAQRHKHRLLFWGSCASFTCVAASLVTTFTRGAWAAIAAAALAMAFMVNRKLVATVLAGGAAVFTALFFGLDLFRIRMEHFFDPNYQSNVARLYLWKINWEIFKDYPILGAGYLENETRAGEYAARMGHPEAFTGHAHNNYLQMLSGTGISGFLTYMFIIGFMLWLTWRLWNSLPKDLIWARAIALGAFGAQVVLHVGGFTECNFKAGATNHNVMVVWALVISMSVLQKRKWLEKYRSELDA